MTKSKKENPSSKAPSKTDILERQEIDLDRKGEVDFKSIDKDIVLIKSQETFPIRDTISVPKDKALDIIAKLRKEPDVCGIEGEKFSDRWPNIRGTPKKDTLERQEIHLDCKAGVDFKSIDKDIVHIQTLQIFPSRVTISVPKDKALDIIAKLRKEPDVCGIEGEKFSDKWPNNHGTPKKDTLERQEIHLDRKGEVDFKSIDKDIVLIKSQETFPIRVTISVPKDKALDIIAKLRKEPDVCGIEGEKFSDRWPNIHNTEVVKPNKQELEKILAAFEKLKNKKDALDTEAKKATDEERKSSYTRAGQALEKTIAWLNAPMTQYKEGIIDIETFKKSVTELFNTDAAKKEMEVINTHRGTKQAWAEFIGAIFTLGLSLVYKALKGHSLFKVNTDTANQLEGFKDSISNTESLNKKEF